MNIDSSRYDIGITLIYQHEHFLRFKMYTLRPEKFFSNWKRFKIDKKCVFLSWKLFSFLRCLGFSPDFFAHLGRPLDKKGEVDFNQTRKFGQLIEHNTRNIFLKKLYTKCGGEISPRTFSKKLKLSISLNQQPEIFRPFVFVVCQNRVQITDYQNTLKPWCWPLAFNFYKTFL